MSGRRHFRMTEWARRVGHRDRRPVALDVHIDRAAAVVHVQHRGPGPDGPRCMPWAAGIPFCSLVIISVFVRIVRLDDRQPHFSYHSPLVVCHSVPFFLFRYGADVPASRRVLRWNPPLSSCRYRSRKRGMLPSLTSTFMPPWSSVAGTVGGYPCSARQSYGSSARVVEYRRDEVSGAEEHVLVRTVPESLSGELAVHVAHQRFSRRPGLGRALPCSRSSPCAAPRPFPSLSGRCLSERDCRRAERPLWA